jgi:hypothetical protein
VYWDDCEIDQTLSDRWFPFGSNGGGEMLCFNITSGTDTIYWIPFIGMSEEEALPQGESFAEIAAAIRKANNRGRV